MIEDIPDISIEQAATLIERLRFDLLTAMGEGEVEETQHHICAALSHLDVAYQTMRIADCTRSRILREERAGR